MINLLASFSDVLSTIFSIILALVILLVMITIHEFGHYIAGKIFKFKINEFAIGMGPAIFKKKRKNSDEIFSIRLFPLGGFCAFAGEDGEAVNEGDFNSKKPWQRIIVLVAGATMNFILGTIILMLSVGIYGQSMMCANEIRHDIGYTQTLEVGDVILEVNGKTIYSSTDIPLALTKCNNGDVVKVKVNNDGKEYTREVKLSINGEIESIQDVYNALTSLGIAPIIKVESTNKGYFKQGDYISRIGDEVNFDDCTRIYDKSQIIAYLKSLSQGETAKFRILRDGERFNLDFEVDINTSITSDESLLSYYGLTDMSYYINCYSSYVKFSFFDSIGRGFRYALNTCGTIFRVIGELFTGSIGLDSMGGTITTISVTTEAIKTGGFFYFLEIAGYIGINLAVFNLLPIPALDGSRVVFCVIEWIRKKPVNRKVEAIIHTVGIIVLLGFSILVDVLHLF